MSITSSSPIEIFLSYAHEDEDLKNKLETHLSILRKNNFINTWSEREILAGTEWEKEIKKHLESANIILLLISADYLNSDRLYEVEMKSALKRHNAGEARAICILLRPVDISNAPFNQIPMLPTNGQPVTTWPNLDNAFLDITERIQAAVGEIQRGQIVPTQSSSPSQGSSAVQPQQPALGNANTNVNPSAQTALTSKEGAPDAMKVTTDKAARKLSEDKLEFAIWVKALSNFIVSQDTTTPLTIGIDGPWGSGKSSFMYMLQDILEPSRNLWRKLREVIWPWFTWFVLFIITSPAWLLFKLLVMGGGRIKGGRLSWVQEINKSLSYDPEIDTDVILSKFQWYKRIAAWTAGCHCPRQPVSHPTIWFNAWKYDQEEQLWAALALAVLDQMKNKYNLLQRIWFWIMLTFKRYSLTKAIFYFALKAIPLILGLIAWQFDVSLKLAAGVYHGNLQGFTSFIPLSQTVLWVGAGITAFLQIASIYKDPFQIPVKQVFDKPDYKEKVGFIGSFEGDFSAIVSVITRPRFGWKPRKLIIFIDDLDRCKLPKAADVIESINLFLDSEQCVFVIGMDTTAVIASIETKYENLFKQIQRERPGIVSAGRLFLEKIIQVPIHVPSTTATGIDNLVQGIIGSGIRPIQEPGSSGPLNSGGTNPIAVAGTPSASTQGGNGATTSETTTGPLSHSQTEQAIKVNRASYSREEVRNAIIFGTSLLSVNPRQVKRFINLFRLYIYVANEQKMFEEEQQVGLTMTRLAAWVAWSIRWEALVRYLSAEIQLSESGLVDLLLKIATSLEKDGCWIKSTPDASGTPPDPPLALATFIQNVAQKQNDTTLHWSRLPWDLWFRDPHFLRSIKELESFWQQHLHSKTNWLSTMLLMTKITFNKDVVQPDNNTSTANGTAKIITP
jgi:hypothetical protein